jgi:hypothetical protein
VTGDPIAGIGAYAAGSSLATDRARAGVGLTDICLVVTGCA